MCLCSALMAQPALSWGVAEPVEVVHNWDGTHTVAYTPSLEGPYTVSVKYADEEVPRSPFRVKVLPTHDASKVKASGPGLTSGLLASLPVEFTVDTRDAGEGQLSVQITVSLGLGLGLGPGLGPTIGIGEEVGFVVNTKGAGKGKVSCTVVTPDGSEVEADVIENEDGTFDIFYTAPKPGAYVLYVRYGGESIPKSPFRVMASDEVPLVEQQTVQQQQAAPLASPHGFQPWFQAALKACLGSGVLPCPWVFTL
ncbi:UNVERIFIED_CONTAM: hypothetical protein FKN15_002795 [Acipenser sinensis]